MTEEDLCMYNTVSQLLHKTVQQTTHCDAIRKATGKTAHHKTTLEQMKHPQTFTF